MSEFIYVSADELSEMDQEIARLEQSVIESDRLMREHRKQGDIRENEEYSQAESNYTRYTQELETCRAKRTRMRVLAEGTKSSKIQVGSRVSLKIGGTTYENLTISASRAIPFESISCDSKLGTLLLGRRANDTFSYVDNLFRLQKVEILRVN